MAIIAICIWLGFLQILVSINVLKGWAMWMKLSPVGLYLAYFLIVAIPMNFIAPKGTLIVLRESVQISPAVSGTVISISAQTGMKTQKGAVLFEIDPEPFAAAVGVLDAQLELAHIRLDQSKELAESRLGSVQDVQKFQAEVRQLESQLKAANWSLGKTKVRAPATGHIPVVALERGAQVRPGDAVLTLIETERFTIAGSIAQGYVRHIEPGQTADVVFRMYPGRVIKAEVQRIVNVTPDGQLAPSGVVTRAQDWTEQPFIVVLELEDGVDLSGIPAGAFGTVAIYTRGMTSIGELIRAVMLRTETWLNYL
jgi:multidrug resistance efflux pump